MQQKAAAGIVCHARGLPAQSGRHSTKFWDVEMRQSSCLNVQWQPTLCYIMLKVPYQFINSESVALGVSFFMMTNVENVAGFGSFF